MENNIDLNSNVIRISIDGDENRVIKFDPNDSLFAEKFYKSCHEIDVKQSAFYRRVEELNSHKKELDDNGIPKNVGDGIAFLKDVCDFMRGQVDYLFGNGTAQMVFGDSRNLETISSFFVQLKPYFERGREKKIEKYTRNRHKPNVMK